MMAILRAPGVALLLTAFAAAGHAQIGGLRMPARNTVSVFATLYTNVDAIYDPDSASRWSFGDVAPGIGLALHRELVSGLQLGVEGSWARVDFERSADGAVVSEGDADLFTGRATARLQAARPGGISGYLLGGIGFFGYRVPDPETVAWDLSLGYGAGLEYRFSAANGVFLEWDRLWAYHESEGIDGDNTARHTMLRLGLRRAF